VIGSVDGGPAGGDEILRLDRDFATMQRRILAVAGIGLHRIDSLRLGQSAGHAVIRSGALGREGEARPALMDLSYEAAGARDASAAMVDCKQFLACSRD
jgi:hypothetical protein